MTSVTPPAGFLAEVSEAEADPTIAGIYEEIRHWSGVPMVALIFRHLATHDGVLPEAWQAVRPLFQSGTIQDTAWRIAADRASGSLMPSIGAAARLAIGLDAVGLRRVRATLRAYNRANPVNLLTMLCLEARLRLAGEGPVQALAASDDSVAWTPPAPIAEPLPGMTHPADMSATVRDLLAGLVSPGPLQRDFAVPSLYRHLTEWPALLAVINVTLSPGFRDGSMTAAAQALQGGLVVEAERLAAGLPALPALAAAPLARETVRRFAGTLIPEMVIVGHALERALDEAKGWDGQAAVP